MPNPLQTRIDYKVVKDPIHTSIELPSDFFKVIDDPLFQRLRFIKQTGLSHCVYPGLRHTRFEHSLGVAHLMLTSLEWIARNTIHVYGESSEPASIARRLVEDPVYWCAAGLAALLHDTGHLTWSHVFEAALRDASVLEVARGRSSSGMSLTSHEQLTMLVAARLLEKHSSGMCGLSGDESKRLVANTLSILTLAYFPEEMDDQQKSEDYRVLYIPARLLSGTIDVDRGDYLLRDSRSAGVSYGLYDIDRLIRVLVLAERLDSNLYDIGIVDKGVSVVENMLLGRMYMYTEVYMHDVVLSYEASAARLLSLLMNLSFEAHEANYPGISGFEKRLLSCIYAMIGGHEDLETGEKLEECARLLTDPPIETLVELLAVDGASIYDMMGRIEGGRWMCPALRIYSHVLTARRHPPSLYLNPNEAKILLRYLESGGNTGFASNVEKYLSAYAEYLSEDPMLVISYINPRVYNPQDPVLVVRRDTRRVYRLEDVSFSAVARLLSTIDARETRSKVVITVPYLGSIRAPMRLRRGKLTESEVLEAYIRCGFSEQEARSRLSKMTRAVEELVDMVNELTRAV